MSDVRLCCTRPGSAPAGRRTAGAVPAVARVLSRRAPLGVLVRRASVSAAAQQVAKAQVSPHACARRGHQERPRGRTATRRSRRRRRGRLTRGATSGRRCRPRRHEQAPRQPGRGWAPPVGLARPSSRHVRRPKRKHPTPSAGVLRAPPRRSPLSLRRDQPYGAVPQPQTRSRGTHAPTATAAAGPSPLRRTTTAPPSGAVVPATGPITGLRTAGRAGRPTRARGSPR